MAYNKHSLKKMAFLLVICLFPCSRPLQAQSIEQLIEQLTLDIQKLSELKTILRDMQDGYQVIDKGYINIRDIVKGNFSLHKTFLDGLLDVSPTVRRYYKVAAIIDRERTIITEYQAANRRWASSGLFAPGELDYVGRMYKALSVRGSQCLDRLTTVITADKLRMSDAERMQAIDRIKTVQCRRVHTKLTATARTKQPSIFKENVW